MGHHEPGGSNPGPGAHSVMAVENNLAGEDHTVGQKAVHQELAGSTMGRTASSKVGLKNAPTLHSQPGYTFSGSYAGVSAESPNKPRAHAADKRRYKKTSDSNPSDWQAGRQSMGTQFGGANAQKQILSTQRSSPSYTLRGNTGSEDKFVGAGVKQQSSKLRELKQKTAEGYPAPADTARAGLPKGMSGEDNISSSGMGKQVVSKMTSSPSFGFGGGKQFTG